MSRLDGGVGTPSSISRSVRRVRSRRGDRVVPAPAGVPVDRFVGSGFVGPRRERPAAGVWDRVSSRPLPPARGAVLRGRFADEPRVMLFLAFAPRAALFAFPARAGFLAERRLAFPFGVFARAVFRFPPRLLRVARSPAPARFFEGVSFWPLLFRFVFAMSAGFLRPVARHAAGLSEPAASPGGDGCCRG
jgi:hypothetical protein